MQVRKTFVNGKKVATKAIAVSDTGTTIMLVPPTVLEAINRVHLLNKTTKCDGSELKDLKIELDVQDTLLVLNGVDLLVPQSIMNIEDGEEKCALGVMQTENDSFLLGDVFIRKYCQVYDYKYKTIGFAVAKDEE